MNCPRIRSLHNQDQQGRVEKKWREGQVEEEIGKERIGTKKVKERERKGEKVRLLVGKITKDTSRPGKGKQGRNEER